MAFRFKRASCVAAGTFNMYVVQPAWLAEVEILPSGTQIAIGSKLDEPGFRFTSPKLAWRLLISPTRLEIDTDSPTEDCGKVGARIFEKLPWTPLTAIGTNALFTANLNEKMRETFAAQLDIPAEFDLVQRSFHVVVSKADKAFNLQLSITRDEIEFSVNVHIDLQGKKRAEAAERARQVGTTFFEDRAKGVELAQNFFDVEVEHGNSSMQAEKPNEANNEGDVG